jgi:hypothetical protein
MDAGWQALSTHAWSGADVSALATLLALPALPPPPLAQLVVSAMIAAAHTPDQRLVRLIVAIPPAIE